MSRGRRPMAKMLGAERSRRIAEHLVHIYVGTGTAEDWDAVTWASTLGGMVINTAGVTLAHGMEHPASGCKDLVHGRGLASLAPVITEYCEGDAPDVYGEIAMLLGAKRGERCSTVLRELLSQLDLNITLGEQGITEEDIPWMVDNFYKVSPASANNHPVLVQREDIEEIYRRAL